MQACAARETSSVGFSRREARNLPPKCLVRSSGRRPEHGFRPPRIVRLRCRIPFGCETRPTAIPSCDGPSCPIRRDTRPTPSLGAMVRDTPVFYEARPSGRADALFPNRQPRGFLAEFPNGHAWPYIASLPVSLARPLATWNRQVSEPKLRREPPTVIHGSRTGESLLQAGIPPR